MILNWSIEGHVHFQFLNHREYIYCYKHLDLNHHQQKDTKSRWNMVYMIDMLAQQV